MEKIVEKRVIKFDPVLHKYTDEQGQVYTSATQLINDVVPQFNHRYWVMYKALEALGHKVKPDIPYNKYIVVGGRVYSLDDLYGSKTDIITGNSIQMIELKWKKTAEDACEKGNVKHNYLEDCIEKFSVDAKNQFNHSLANLGFAFKITSVEQLEKSPLKESDPLVYTKLANYIKDGWVIYAEKRVYNPIHHVAGTIDVLLVRGLFFKILDWKTNKDPMHFSAGYYKKVNGVKTNEWIPKSSYLLAPLSHLENCKGMIYTMQLSIYAYMCEMWGLVHDGLELCHFNDTPIPSLYNIEYKKKEVEALFNWKVNKDVPKVTKKLSI